MLDTVKLDVDVTGKLMFEYETDGEDSSVAEWCSVVRGGRGGNGRGGSGRDKE